MSEGNNYFYHTRKLRQIRKNETIYFSFDGYLIATGVFLDNIIEDRNRDSKFIFGHQLSNIQIIKFNPTIDSAIFGTNTTYLDTDEKLQEIVRIINI